MPAGNLLYWAIVALVIAVVAGALGFGGIAGAAAGIAKILFWVFLVIFLVVLVYGFHGQGQGTDRLIPTAPDLNSWAGEFPAGVICDSICADFGSRSWPWRRLRSRGRICRLRSSAPVQLG